MDKKTGLIKKKLLNTRGFSLGELLAATVILLLASQILAQGVAYTVRMYNESLTRSNARQLCSSLTAVIETELRYTTSITYDANTGKLLTYFSRDYGQSSSGFLSIDSDDNEVAAGEIAIRKSSKEQGNKYYRLLSSSTYSSYDLEAKVDSATYDSVNKKFTIKITIYAQNGDKQLETTFDVIPANDLKIN